MKTVSLSFVDLPQGLVFKDYKVRAVIRALLREQLQGTQYDPVTAPKVSGTHDRCRKNMTDRAFRLMRCLIS